MKWFYKDWWAYLLARRADNDTPWRVVIMCRMRGHPAGVYWYNPGGYSPEMHCKGCGDNLA